MTLFYDKEKQSIKKYKSRVSTSIKIIGLEIRNGIPYHIPNGSGSTVTEPAICEDCHKIFYLADPSTYAKKFGKENVTRDVKSICRYCKSHNVKWY